MTAMTSPKIVDQLTRFKVETPSHFAIILQASATSSDCQGHSYIVQIAMEGKEGVIREQLLGGGGYQRHI